MILFFFRRRVIMKKNEERNIFYDMEDVDYLKENW